MHTVTELETNVPAFLGKLWKLVEDSEHDDLICWAPNGRSFFIRHQAQFARELLPHYYKHNNMASFVRQLNMYGFHKKVSVELGGLKCDKDEMEFAHQYFVKGHPYLLEHIKRKIATNKGQDSSNQSIKPEVMNKLLSEVRTMRVRQEHLDTRLGAMKRENEALWREIVMVRRKHIKQQQIVNKLIHFLVTLVQPPRTGGLPVKRRYPLMIDSDCSYIDNNRLRNKQSKLAKPETSPTGPVIHELDASEHDLDSHKYIVADVFEDPASPAVHSAESHDLSTMEDEAAKMIENVVYIPKDIESISSRQLAPKKKSKGKKKRKNKVPIKILIPATESGEEAREETLMLEVSPEEEAPISIVERDNNASKMKPVPVRTLRSSKLAAMAANINKMNDIDEDVDMDFDSSEDADDVQSKVSNIGVVRLEDIFGTSEDTNEMNEENEDDPDDHADTKKGIAGKSWTNINGTMNYNKKSNDSGADKRSSTSNFGEMGHTESERVAGSKGGAAAATTTTAVSTSKSKDLSLSCVNQSGISGATYREDMDNHVETIETGLENLREMLLNEGYSIDTNTLNGLFGMDDPMSFGIPVNPELDPHYQRDRDEVERVTDNSGYTSTGGELMAYTNPGQSLLDFDDDIFLEAGEEITPSVTTGNTDVDNYYNTDLLDLEDSKASLLASLVAASDGKPSTS